MASKETQQAYLSGLHDSFIHSWIVGASHRQAEASSKQRVKGETQDAHTSTVTFSKKEIRWVVGKVKKALVIVNCKTQVKEKS